MRLFFLFEMFDKGFAQNYFIWFIVIILAFSALFALFLGQLLLLLKGQFSAARVREYTPQTHQKKNETPTMAGLIVLGSVILTTLLCAGVASYVVWFLLGSFILFAGIGLWDDSDKLCKRRGISAFTKIAFQVGCSLLIFLVWRFSPFYSSIVYIPGIATISVENPWIYGAWVILVIIACSNAVNLTDGLDGLAAGSLIPVFLLWSVIATGYLQGYIQLSLYQALAIDDLWGIMIVGYSLVGSLCGFLWYNRHPARMFMGDVGSLFLGAAMGLIALLFHLEFFLALAGLVFIAETVSVMLQVVVFRQYKRRLFKMAPLHHHFELCGYSEQAIVGCFTLLSWVLCGITLLIMVNSF